MNVVITGGAGFIGTHLARRLLREGLEVTLLDNFSPQIHGGSQTLPQDLAPNVRLIAGDVRDAGTFQAALTNQEVVVHLAAETGTGQSMYEIAQYTGVNLTGTAHLMDYLVNSPQSRIGKIVTASSRAIYGEGKYQCSEHGVVYPEARSGAAMSAEQFEPVCPLCALPCSALPTDEGSRLSPSSYYGLTKQMQEQMTLLFARTCGLSGYALRYQNVYGPGQSLRNPYTGILAIFSNQARAGEPIYIFEDGHESRDFVYIEDIIEATWKCIHPETVGVDALNVGSGVKTTVQEVVAEIVRFFGSASDVSVTGAFRLGDIRHNVADLTRARMQLGFEPRWAFVDGIREFLTWAQTQEGQAGGYAKSLEEMRSRGLMHG